MKKLALFLITFILIFSCACSKQEVVSTPQSDASQDAVPVARENEFCKMMNTDVRPVAVMIDNDGPSSRPQAGVENAYMVYEIIVEGGASRMMALFKNHDLEKVGPIRSSRHYFLDYALEHDAIYCHAGWSPKAMQDITALGVNNINGILGDDGTVYWRDYTYDKTWHNLYSGLDKLFEKGTNHKNYRATTDVRHNLYSNEDVTPESSTNATQITLPYSNTYTVKYFYDSENKVYNRHLNGVEHTTQAGGILSAKNIIIYKVKNYNLPDPDNVGRQELVNIGSGSGYYVTNGKCINITWEKQTRAGKTIYYTEDGKELVLNPGNTFVQIIPEISNITIS